MKSLGLALKFRKIKRFVFRHFEGSLIVLIFVGALAIAFLVNYKLSFLNFFFLPVILSGYFLGKRNAVLTAFFCVLLVVLGLVFMNYFTHPRIVLSFDDFINLVTWGSFLVLTGAIVGTVSEQKESKLAKLRQSYVGVLDILFKYLEVADEKTPHSVRVSHIAGKISETVGLEKRDVENIKSAALLIEAGDLHSSIPFFGEVSGFLEAEGKVLADPLKDREKVILKTAGSLLKEVEPVLANYYLHYVQEAHTTDKDFDRIPMGSSIIALADVYDRIVHNLPNPHGLKELTSLSDIRLLSGRYFPDAAVQALQLMTASE